MNLITTNGIQHVGPRDLLPLLTEWVSSRLPFYYVRFNDGEFLCMLRMKTKNDSVPSEVYFTEAMADSLIDVFNKFVTYSTSADPRERMLMGSWWYYDPTYDVALAIKRWLKNVYSTDVLARIPWAMGELWYNSQMEVDGECLQTEFQSLIDSLRNTPAQKVVYIGNAHVAKAVHCMGAEFIEVPILDSSKADERVMKRCRALAAEHENIVFLWSAGFVAKVWSWSIWEEFPHTSHIDIGHLFDGIFGNNSRSWLQQENGVHLDYYRNVITPWVKSFIPE